MFPFDDAETSGIPCRPGDLLLQIKQRQSTEGVAYTDSAVNCTHFRLLFNWPGFPKITPSILPKKRAFWICNSALFTSQMPPAVSKHLSVECKQEVVQLRPMIMVFVFEVSSSARRSFLFEDCCLPSPSHSLTWNNSRKVNR